MTWLRRLAAPISRIFRGRSQSDVEEMPARPARPPRGEESVAHPSTDKPPEHHHGRRAVKEWFTNHWDMDYMSREEIERLQQELSEPEKKNKGKNQ